MNAPIARKLRIAWPGQSITWRGILLAALYLVPPVVYFCLGAWWLFEKGLLIYGLVGWLACTIAFSILSRRWLKGAEKVLPPLDWEKPWTFAPRDAQAWAIVQETAERGADLTLDRLSRIETYRDTSDELARRVAACYYPNVENPLDKLPIVDLIVAIQLAADDLERLCRQIPVMDQLTPGHLKGLSKAMGVAQSANELYNFALPVFRPVTGIPRLLVQKLVAEPAWRQTKEGVQRWLYRAYVNRLGVHLVELCSGRLRAGSTAYRRSASNAGEMKPDASPGEPTNAGDRERIVLRSTVLLPGFSEKGSLERIGAWRHLATTGQHEIAEALNDQFRTLEGVEDLPDIVWLRTAWPSDPDSLLPAGNGEPWDETLEKLVETDMIVADFRHLSDDEAAERAQSLIDHLGTEYDRKGDWPVAPIVLLCDPGVLASLKVHPHLLRETKISEAASRSTGSESAEFEPADSREPEVETLAAISAVVPLARQRRFARQMAAESRKSGVRRAAGQVAEAAGKAGMDLIRGWFDRKAKPATNTTETTKRPGDDDATSTTKPG
ncbi:hypothetical protein GC170_03875 [bacterium]|nr:hypothetical protein [bacterium]